MPERLGSTGLGRGISGGTPEARVDGGPQHTDRYSLGVGRRGGGATVRAGAWSHCSPTSFFRTPRPPRPRCCNRHAPSPSFLHRLPIPSVAPLSRACRGLAATSPVLSL